jgi:hypothetical protein
MKLRFLIAAVLAAAPLAGADAMPVSEFLAKANALKAKGIAALFSSDIGLLKNEIGGAFRQVRADDDSARKAGRRPSACLPAKASVRSDELLSYMNAIPPAQRGMSVAAAMHGFAAKKFPCPR